MGIALFSMRFRFRLTGYCGAIMEKKMGVEKRETRRLRRKFNGLPADGFFSSANSRRFEIACWIRIIALRAPINQTWMRLNFTERGSNRYRISREHRNCLTSIKIDSLTSRYIVISISIFSKRIFLRTKVGAKLIGIKKKKKIRRKTHPNKNSKGGNDRYDTRNS